MKTRKFTSYETNLLLQNNIDPFSIDHSELGEMPIEYFIGKAEFYGEDFLVNKNVLIPRVESEKMIDLAYELVTEFKTKNRVFNFAEIGTGSGAIGISLVKKLQQSGVVYNAYISDISEKALSVAKVNAERILKAKYRNCITQGVVNPEENKKKSTLLGSKAFPKSKLKFIKSDLLENYPKKLKGQLDLIIANLPYIPSERILKLSPSVKDYEPLLALDGGTDGLNLIKKLLKQSVFFLSEEGVIILEVDDTHSQKVANEVANKVAKGVFKIKAEKDLNMRWRYWVVFRR
ncbi:MAG: hypothetical protein Kow0081_3190 [Candidatus Dojkabacteria bacterium]